MPSKRENVGNPEALSLWRTRYEMTDADLPIPDAYSLVDAVIVAARSKAKPFAEILTNQHSQEYRENNHIV